MTNRDANVGDTIFRQAAIDVLDEIRHALWEIDIPSPTVPEYVEHHEQVQSVWKLLDKKQKELYLLPSTQSEIIRCKDCKHMITHEGYGYLGEPAYTCEGNMEGWVLPNSFCSHAERKDGEHDE